MNIDSVRNGVVIDHITAGNGARLYELLGLDGLTCTVAFIRNVPSKKMGRKDIIKIGELIDLNFDVLGYVDPGITVSIVRDGKLISKGANRVVPTNDPTAHAEVSAIRAACEALGTFSLEGCDIYSSCEPCPMCLGAIYWAHLDHLYYGANKHDAADAGFDDQFIYEELEQPIPSRTARTCSYQL